jgi:predicted outer membrane repeat protein
VWCVVCCVHSLIGFDCTVSGFFLFLLFVTLSSAQTRVLVNTVEGFNIAVAQNVTTSLPLEIEIPSPINISSSVTVDGKNKQLSFTCNTGACFSVQGAAGQATVRFLNFRVFQGQFQLFLATVPAFNGRVSIESSSFSRLSESFLDVRGASTVSVTNSNFTDSSTFCSAALKNLMSLGSSNSRIQSVTLTGVRASNNELCDSFVSVGNVTSLVVSGSVFEQQTVDDSVIIARGRNGSMSVDTSVFVDNFGRTRATSNTTEERGTAIRLEGTDNVAHVRRSLFDNCTATSGGALATIGLSNVFNLTQCRFHSNVARRDGGAVIASVLYIASCVFDENRAGDDGGVIYVNVLAAITDTDFSGNVGGSLNETGALGGVLLTGSAVVEMSRVSVTGNTMVGPGIGVVVLNLAASSLNLTDTCICNNTASVAPVVCNTLGNIVTTDSASVLGLVSNCTFGANSMTPKTCASTVCPKRAPDLSFIGTPIGFTTNASLTTNGGTSTTVAADSNSVAVSPESDDPTVGIAVGAAIGGLVLIGIVGVTVYFWRTKAKKSASAEPVGASLQTVQGGSEYGVLPGKRDDMYDDVSDVKAPQKGNYDAPDSTLVF